MMQLTDLRIPNNEHTGSCIAFVLSILYMISSLEAMFLNVLFPLCTGQVEASSGAQGSVRHCISSKALQQYTV